MDNKDLSRRDFIQRISLLGAAGLGAGSLLAACGGGGDQPADMPPADQAAGFTCTDTSGLTEADIALRTNLQYADKSPKEGETCNNCALYLAPEAGQQCGGCSLVKGPIHPDGYCTSWAPKPA